MVKASTKHRITLCMIIIQTIYILCWSHMNTWHHPYFSGWPISSSTKLSPIILHSNHYAQHLWYVNNKIRYTQIAMLCIQCLIACRMHVMCNTCYRESDWYSMHKFQSLFAMKERGIEGWLFWMWIDKLGEIFSFDEMNRMTFN